MSSRIYYFSGTGNSLAAARAIGKKLGDCELVSVSRALSEKELLSCPAKAVGIVTPNYYMGLPLAVAEFLRKVSLTNEDYLFMVVTSGHNFGVVISQAQEIFKEKGKKLDYGAYLVMPDNYLPMFNISPDKAGKILKKAGVRLERISADIAASVKKISENHFFLGSKMQSWNKANSAKFPGLDSNFTVDDTCTSCALCEKVCPVKNVEMNGPRPVWKHHCEQCYACMHFCPAAAIQYGKTTAGRYRYHHPDITAQDIADRNS